MERGYVQKWGRETGFGYVIAPTGRYYFHATTIVTDAPVKQRNLMNGQLVEFEPGITRRGPIATSVRALRPDEAAEAK